MAWSVFDARGRRKYLNRGEVERFLDTALDEPASVYAFCRLMAETGCRISEALGLTLGRIEIESGTIVFESLKKRRRGVFRSVPVSPYLARLLLDLPVEHADARIWSWTRMTAWRHVHRIFTTARIHGAQASPKGLRHGFAVGSIGAGVPLNLVQRWLGHADIRTTAIYADAVGPEELAFAERVRANYLSVLVRRGSTHRHGRSSNRSRPARLAHQSSGSAP
ncbi:tyrosine-type recombinase/integrase [Novosphingobium sp. JCM 18896]|uniref:tyrosine-type recombinase/integrase n=1 Tax=Novosphingobium sp. JCM 18896 TaxID=2989731 RepID=UPI0022236E4C|nr:site-specific integrase [Novosphingobium sp. JCM 18896]MCW1430810.1 site-specific integrase [Novosphingobium sp. JCM 18896]